MDQAQEGAMLEECTDDDDDSSEGVTDIHDIHDGVCEMNFSVRLGRPSYLNSSQFTPDPCDHVMLQPKK